MRDLKKKLVALVERYLDGSIKIGPLMIYGANAMDWAVNLRVASLGVTLCAKPTTARRGWYFYASPNATPWAAVLGCGPGLGRENGVRVAERLHVIAGSPRPEVEAESLWLLWGMGAGSAGEGAGGGSSSVENASDDPPVSIPSPAKPAPKRRTFYLGDGDVS